MKFGFSNIFRDHFATLIDDRKGRLSLFDLVVFFLFPIIIAYGAYSFQDPKLNSPIGLFVSAISLFSALLVSSQFSIHAMLARQLPKDDDEIQLELLFRERGLEIEVLGEINATISYLIVIGILSIAVAFALIVLPVSPNSEAAAMGYLTAHFILTLLVVTKRIHILLRRSYERSKRELKDAQAEMEKLSKPIEGIN